MMLHRTLACSEIGNTNGPSCVKLIFIALPATLTISFESRTPEQPDSSSH